MGERSMRTLRRRLSRVGAGIASLTYPAIAVMILGLAIADLPNTVRAARNDGIPGTFTVTRKVCKPWWEKGGGCTRFGDFVSRDGTIELRDVLFVGNAGDVGDVVPAQTVDPEDRRVDEINSNEWAFLAMAAFAAAGYLAWRVIRAVRRRRSRTKPRRRSPV